MDTTVRIACCQFAPDVERPQSNPDRAQRAIAEAIAQGAQIIVLPELCNSGYVFDSEAEARAAAAPADGDLLRSWAEEAKRGDAIVVGGFAELATDGTVYNSCALVDGTGVRGVYRKVHLWDKESRWFAPGEEPAPVIDTAHGLLGLAICYDIEFPELTRGLALQGAELIVLPANWPHDDDPPNHQPILHSLAGTTAYLNKVFVAVCDRCGTERGAEFEGGSVIADPQGALIAGPIGDRGAATISADCDLTTARDKRTTQANDAFADRRSELYATALSHR
jgi:predicted amidohydrolase